ncbi:hypothetical protein [Pectinatus frisingensis]|uniref:hypothetical protein n=1 Tax=Pectinatus frisingensis TaxID=865 RepID=UPI0018C655A5|nr:hypothetical protein [Pectinatus frisingensis]
MISDVEICNLALSKIGESTINTLTEASVEAQACTLYYPNVRDNLLRQYPWNFTSKSVQLGQAAIDIPENTIWQYLYTYPSDCLRIRKVFENGSYILPVPNDFEIISCSNVKYICCDIYQAYCRYTQQITDPTLFDSCFVDALACKLAMELAVPLTNSSDRLKIAMQLFQTSIATAMMSEAIEGNEQIWPSEHQKATTKYIDARR